MHVLPVCKTVNVKVATVVDVKENVADCIGKSESLSLLRIPVVHQIKTRDHIEECLGSGEQSVEHQGGHQQQADKRKHEQDQVFQAPSVLRTHISIP